MLERIGRGWGIARVSWAVVKAHPKLLLLPIFSGAAFMALLAAIGISIFAGSKSDTLRQSLDGLLLAEPAIWALLFLLYFVFTFIIIFFNAALVFCALQSFAGKEPSLRAGIATAAGRLPQILAWTFIAATVGLLLNALQSLLKDKLGFLGALLGGLTEMAWAVVTYFVVPVLVVDGVGPIEAVKRSTAILRRTWGEALAGEGGLGAIALVFILPAVLALGALGASNAGAWASPEVVIALIATIALYVVALSVVFTALSTVFLTGAYIYATTGKAPGAIDPALLQGTFHKKS